MKFFKKSDIIILLLILSISAVSWAAYRYFFSAKRTKAEIYYNNRLVETIDLNSGIDRTFSIPQNRNVIFHQYSDGSIRFEKSDCPDKICVNTGRLKTVGQTAACIPNGIFLKIVPANSEEGGVDAVAGR